MPTTKATRQKVTTPIGVFSWPFIDHPDQPFKDGDVPTYRVDLVFDPDNNPADKVALDVFKEQLFDFAAIRRQELLLDPDVEIRLPIIPQMEKVEGKTKKQPTGRTMIRTKLYSERKVKDRAPMPQRPEVMDASMQRWEKDEVPPIGNGSEGRVAGTLGASYSGKDECLYITVYMDGVQVTKLVERGNFDPDSYDGLGAVDGGYEAPQPVDAEGGDDATNF